VGHVAYMREVINAYEFVLGKPEGKRPLRRPRCKRERIKLDLSNRMGGRGLDSTWSVQGISQSFSSFIFSLLLFTQVFRDM
jgi:hypothetical protein